MAVLLSHGLASQQPARDTVVIVDAPTELSAATEWGLLVLVALASVNAVVLLAFVWRVDGLTRRLINLARQVEDKSGPVLERAAAIADNLDGITRSVRGDVEHFTGSVHAVSDRLTQASEHMETRIDEFNALLEVVQSEAEEMFLDTASAVHGVRAGARALEHGSGTAPSAEAGERALSAGPEDGESSRTVRASRPHSGRKLPVEEVRQDGQAELSEARRGA